MISTKSFGNQASAASSDSTKKLTAFSTSRSALTTVPDQIRDGSMGCAVSKYSVVDADSLSTKLNSSAGNNRTRKVWRVLRGAQRFGHLISCVFVICVKVVGWEILSGPRGPEDSARKDVFPE